MVRPLLWTLCVPAACGVLVGTHLLRTAEPRTVKTALGATVFCLAVLQWGKIIVEGRMGKKPGGCAVPEAAQVANVDVPPDPISDQESLSGSSLSSVAPACGAGGERAVKREAGEREVRGAVVLVQIGKSKEESIAGDSGALQRSDAAVGMMNTVEDRVRARPMFVMALLAGLASGILNGLVGVGGPPLMIYVMCARLDKRATRATAVALVMFMLPFQAVVLVTDGLVRPELALPLYTPAVIAAAVGLWMGHRLHSWQKVTDRHVRITVLSLLSISAALLWGAGDTEDTLVATGVLIAWIASVWLWMRYVQGYITRRLCAPRIKADQQLQAYCQSDVTVSSDVCEVHAGPSRYDAASPRAAVAGAGVTPNTVVAQATGL